MKISMGVIVAIVTMVGSILIGGANFGEVRGNVSEHTNRLNALDDRMKTVEGVVQEMNSRSIKMATDLEWIRGALVERKEVR